MTRTDEESADELEGMLTGPPKTARRWPWVVVATAVVGAVCVGMRQLTPRDERSFRDHVSFVHGKIGAVIAAATEKKQSESSIEFIVDEYGAKAPSALPLKVELTHGGEGNFPQIVITVTAKKSTAALKAQLQKILDAEQKVLGEDDPDIDEEIEKALDIDENEDDGTVAITMNLPKGPGAEKEDEELKKALKDSKPKLTGEITFAQTFDQILDAEDDNVIAAVRGVEAKLSAVIADALMVALSDMPGAPPAAQAAVGLVRKSKIRSEIYYDKDKMMNFPSLPRVKQLLGTGCSMLPPDVAKALKSLTELDGIKSVVLQGLPYDWKLALKMKNFKPTPIVKKCEA